MPQFSKRHRAFCKLLFLLSCVLAALAAILLAGLDKSTLDVLRHSLSLWTLLALVVLINLVSLILFAIIYAAYRWVREDLGHRHHPLDE